MINHWPVAIIADRYGGSYSGGGWLAISEANERVGGGSLASRVDWCLEDGPHGDDTDAMMFWASPPAWIAAGHTPDKALAALQAKEPPHE